MKETRFFYVPEADSVNELPEEEVKHAIKVLRMKPGDNLMLMDGCGSFYQAELTLVSNHRCQYRIVEQLPQKPQWLGHTHLAIAPTKLIDRIEWMTEKAVEIGLDELSFLDCQFSERHSLKPERIKKIVVSAVKQSHKAFMPVVNDQKPFKTFVSAYKKGHRYIAHCYEEVPRVNLFDELCAIAPTDDVLVMVGPEGDFSIDEVRMAVDAGFISVDLGKSRLRTETAGLASVMMMQLAKQTKREQ